MLELFLINIAAWIVWKKWRVQMQESVGELLIVCILVSSAAVVGLPPYARYLHRNDPKPLVSAPADASADTTLSAAR